MKKIFPLVACLLWGAASTVAMGQYQLNRTSFQTTPVFDEEFSYQSVNDPQFKERWDAEFYTGIGGSTTEYSLPSQLEMMPGGFIKLHTTRLATLEERIAATADAASHGVIRPDPIPPGPLPAGTKPRHSDNGGSIAYASCKLISRVAVDSLRPTSGTRYDGFTYGLFEIRCKLPNSGRGIWPAFWLHSPSTEIDIIDNGTDLPHRQWQHGVLDWGRRWGFCEKNKTTGFECWTRSAHPYKKGADLSQEFNTYSAVWTPEEVTFYFNDREVFSVPATILMTHRETARIILDVATQWDDNFASGEMIVDYIKVWKFNSPTVPFAHRSLQKNRHRKEFSQKAPKSKQ